MPPPSSAEFAIIGAGIAGLACARQLQAAGRMVQLFDKGRRPGGRVATRRLDGGLEFDRVEFDHGAQYFTVRHAEFEEWLRPSLERGQVAEWTGRLVSLSNGRTSPEPSPGRRYVGREDRSKVRRARPRRDVLCLCGSKPAGRNRFRSASQ